MILESNLIVKHLVSFSCCQPQRRTPVFFSTMVWCNAEGPDVVMLFLCFCMVNLW